MSSDKKSILYFMPDNPVMGKAGNLTRCVQILDYLYKNRKYFSQIEFLSVSDWGEWNEEGVRLFKEKYPEIKLTLINRKISSKEPLKQLFLYKIPNLIPKLLRGTSVDITNFYFRKKVKKHLNANHYDCIIMSYTSWGSLVTEIKRKPYLILDTHDFMTAQSKYRFKNTGKLFDSELNVLRMFNELWTLSVEEKYIYEQFTKSKVVYHPVLYPPNDVVQKTDGLYDIIYVASINPHNISSINWFFKNVYPLLSSYKIHIIGRICGAVKEDYPNVIKHGLVEDIQYFYKNARIAICPMLSGTGVKIKVIEALANHIPVVTNTRGVDGLLNKTNNGCLVSDDPIEYAAYIKLLMEDETALYQLKNQAKEYMINNHSTEKKEQLFHSLKQLPG